MSEEGRKGERNAGREMEAELCAVSVVLILGWACKRCNNKSQPLPPHILVPPPQLYSTDILKQEKQTDNI